MKYFRGALLILIVFYQISCSYLSKFEIECDRKDGFVVHSPDYATTFAFLEKDPKDGKPSASLQVKSGPLISYHGLGSLTEDGGYSSFYVPSKGFYFDDNLDGFPDRLLALDGKEYIVEMIIRRKK